MLTKRVEESLSGGHDLLCGELIWQIAEVESKGTFQGYADSSAWARGQAWGVYGYTMCYRFTKQQSHLDAAHKIARFIDHRPSENDYVTYWDYDAPNIPNEPRDALRLP